MMSMPIMVWLILITPWVTWFATYYMSYILVVENVIYVRMYQV